MGSLGHPTENQELLVKAVSAFNRSEVGEARGLFEQAIREMPAEWRAWSGFVLCSLDSGSAAEARLFFEQSEGSKESARDLGYALFLCLTARRDAMAECLAKAAWPQHLGLVHQALQARCFRSMGRRQDAEEISRRLAAEACDSPFVAISADLVLEDRGDWDARRCFWKSFDSRSDTSYSADVYGSSALLTSRLVSILHPDRKFSDNRKRYEMELLAREYASNADALRSLAISALVDLRDATLGQRLAESALAKNPNIRIRRQLANVARLQDRDQEVGRLLFEEVKSYPESVDSHLGAAQQMLLQGNPGEAIRLCEEGVDCCGKETALLLLMATAATAAGVRERALGLVGEAASIGNLAGESLATAAGVAISAGDLDLCKDLLHLRRPGDNKSIVAASLLAAKEGRLDEVVDDLKKAFEEDDDLEKGIPEVVVSSLAKEIEACDGQRFAPELIRHVGVSLAYNNRLADGLEMVKLAISRGDVSQDVFRHAISMSIIQEDFLVAQEHALNAARNDALAKEPLVHLVSAMLNRAGKHSVDAFMERLMASALLPENLLPPIAEFYARFMDDSEQAITILENRIGPDCSTETYNFLAQWLADAGYDARAAEVCRTALERFPDDGQILGRLSLALEKLGRAKESLEYCRRCLEKEPSHSWALKKIVKHLKVVHEPDKARAFLSRAVEDAPEAANIRLDFANFLIGEFNDPVAASEQLELALAGDPENTTIKRRLDMLRKTSEKAKKSFSDQELGWLVKNRQKVEQVVDGLRAKLKDELHICALIPRTASGDVDSGSEKSSDTSSEQGAPTLLLVFADADADSDDIDAVVKQRVETTQAEIEKAGLEIETDSRHWSGLWRKCLDGDFALLESLEVGRLVYDRGYGVGLRHLWRHRNRVLEKFEKYVAAYVVAGSFVRGQSRDDSDIDVWVVLDDTDVKKMTRSELNAKIRAIIVGYAPETAEELGIEDRLHVQSYLLTNYWSALKDADPVITTFLRDGRPLHDRGIFTAWRVLREDNRLAPPREAIAERLRVARETFGKLRGALYSIAEQMLYAPMLSAAQAVLLAYGEQPPTPLKTAQLLRQLEIMGDAELQGLEQVVKLLDDCKHGGLDAVSAEILDRITAQMPAFLQKAEHAVEEAFTKAQGLDRTGRELLVEYDFWLRELAQHVDLPGSIAQQTPMQMAHALVAKGAIDPLTLRVLDSLTNEMPADRTAVPNAREHVVLELGRKQLIRLQERVAQRYRDNEKQRSISFRHAGQRGKLVRSDESLFVIHDPSDIDSSRVSRISLAAEDYGSVYLSSLNELGVAGVCAPREAPIPVTERIMRSIRVAVGSDPEITIEN